MSSSSRGRPRRAAAWQAELLIQEHHHIAHQSTLPINHEVAAAILDDDDHTDASYAPSRTKRQKSSSSSPFTVVDDTPLPPPVAFTSDSSSSPRSGEFDIWDEDPQDIRHQRTRLTGCYVIAPLYRLPAGYIDEQRAKAADEEKQPTPSTSSSPRVLLPSGLTSLSPTEPLSSLQARDAALTSALSTLSSYFSSLITSSHHSTFSAIHRWLTSTPHNPDPYSLSNLVPTAFVYCGVNVDDHPLLFSELASYLTSPPSSSPSPSPSCHCLPLVLTSSSCSTVDKTIQHLLLSLVTSFPTSSQTSSITRRSHSSSHFLHLHEQHTQRAKHLMKDLWGNFTEWWKLTQSDHSPHPLRVLVIISDPHAFDPALLTSVLYLLLAHPILSPLPWCFMFGLSLDGRVMKQLSERVLSKMKVTSFHLTPSSSLLKPVMEGLWRGGGLPVPVLSGGVLSWLMKGYGVDHQSLTEWWNVLRVIVVEYYGRVEYGQLTHWWREGKGGECIMAMKDEEVNELYRLVRADGVGGGGKSRRPPDGYRAQVVEWMKQFDDARARLVLGCRVVQGLADRLLPNTGEKDERSIFLQVYGQLEPGDGNAVTSFEEVGVVKAVMQAMRSQPTATVQLALQSMMGMMEEAGEEVMVEQVREVMERVKEGEVAAVKRVSGQRASAKPVRTTNEVSRREAMMGGLGQAKREREAVREQACSFLSSFLSTHLVALSSLPLSSLIVFHSSALPSLFSIDQQGGVIATLTGAPVSSSLSSYAALPQLSPSMSDMSIAFRFYMEADLHLDLYQWFKQFCGVLVKRPHEVGGSGGQSGGKRRRSQRGEEEVKEGEGEFLQSLDEEVRNELYVRFNVCVNALRWCGFIKPANGKRARDEMIKLVFLH